MTDEWIEIVEPNSSLRMFANVTTGACVWEEPTGVPIARADTPSVTQWWELFDARSRRYYYYCARDRTTVWRRPNDANSIVVPLAKLQVLHKKSASTAATADAGTQTTSRLTRTTATQTPDDDPSHGLSANNPSLRRYLLSDMRCHGIRLVGSRFGDDIDEDLDDDDDIEQSDDESFTDYNADNESSNEDETDVDDDSSDDHNDSQHVTVTDSVRSRTPEAVERSVSLSTIAVAAPPVDARPRPQTPPTRVSSLAPPARISTMPKSRASAPPPFRPPHAPPPAVRATPAQTTSASTTTNTSQPFESFARENVSRHRKGLIRRFNLKSMLSFSKKSIQKPILSSIEASFARDAVVCFKLVQTFMRDRVSALSDVAVAFDLVTRAATTPQIRDEVLVQCARQTTANPNADSERRGLELLAACLHYWSPSAKLAPHLNAFAAQHANPFAAVVRARIEVQARRLASANIAHVHFVRKPLDERELSRVLCAVRAQHVGLFGQSLEEALPADGKRSVPWPVVCLTEALLRTKCDAADREGVFRCVGDTDSVHRLRLLIDTKPVDVDPAADHDLALALADESADVHVIASTLKLYFRELKEPLVPFRLYGEALEAAHDPRRACALVEAGLPATHRHALGYLVRFLQVFAAEEHVRQTRMDDANLSMVWAPNVLRAPPPSAASAAPTTPSILEWTRAEMSFVRTLIQHLDTSFMYARV